MKILDYDKRESKWKIYHEFEEKEKERRLTKLSTRTSFDILKELYQFSHNLNTDMKFNSFDMEKIKTLSNIHHIFGRVEA